MYNYHPCARACECTNNLCTLPLLNMTLNECIHVQNQCLISSPPITRPRVIPPQSTCIHSKPTAFSGSCKLDASQAGSALDVIRTN